MSFIRRNVANYVIYEDFIKVFTDRKKAKYLNTKLIGKKVFVNIFQCVRLF